MAKYLTQDDVITAYGETRFSILADDGGGQPNADRVANAIEYAESEMDSYFISRYALPLPGIVSEVDPLLNTVPSIIKNRGIDIAVYYLSQDHDAMTEIREKRYTTAMEWLDGVAKGLLGIGQNILPDSTNSGAVTTGPVRALQRCQTEGLV